MKVLILKGLPASGKTTYAKDLVNRGWKRVNKDDLRKMMDNSRWSNSREFFVLYVRDMIITKALSEGKNIVVDDTNLAEKHINRIVELAKPFEAEIEIKFFEVSVEEAIRRDLQRPNSVGHKVITSMYNQFLAPKPKTYQPPDKEEAIICDVDGTLALMFDRSPFDWDKVGQDKPNIQVVNIVRTYFSNNTKVILLSGRNDVCRKETEKWLEDNKVPYDHLYMRKNGDNRKDTEVKLELFDEHIRDNFNVLFVLDDRDQVVALWRDEGLTCLQVAPGDF